MGRHTDLDDLVEQRICNALARGMSRKAACGMARIAERTFYEWLARGRDGEDRFAQFSQRVEESEAQAEGKVVDHLLELVEKGNAQATIFWLKARAGWRDSTPVANDAEAAQAAAECTDDLEAAEAIVSALKSRKVGA